MGGTIKFLFWTRPPQPAGLAQLVERCSRNPKIVSCILTPGNFAWMSSEGSGLGLLIQRGLTSQWFESTFCASPLLFWFGWVVASTTCAKRNVVPCGARTRDLWLTRPILYRLSQWSLCAGCGPHSAPGNVGHAFVV